MKPSPGTYALMLRSSANADVDVGCWGRLHIAPGFYIYIGSAFGPGGVRARVSRHFRATKRNRWHIDYLRAATEPIGAWCSYVPDRLEHQWAQAFSRMKGVSCVNGFGASDCGCAGHLFVMSRIPGSAELIDALDGEVEFYEYRI